MDWMKMFFDAITGSLKMVIAVVTTVVGTWLWIEARWDSKVSASETKIMKEVELMREADMNVIQGIKDDTAYIKRRIDRMVDRDYGRR